MQSKTRHIIAILMTGATALGGISVAQAFDGQQYARQAKFSLQQARHLALNTYRGHIVAEELEKERGGSGLRYSFDIRRGHVTHEVGVDAKTGRVLENSVEGPHAD